VTRFPEFILASASPRRRDLLAGAGYRFEVVPPTLPEPVPTKALSDPAPLAEALAYFKARSVEQRAPDRVVLGADTIVSCRGEILGKAGDADEARRMLSALSGSTHSVITGLAVLAPGPGQFPRRYLASDTTSLVMRELSVEEIDGYVASGEWCDKAGAYAIQETADAFVERIDGSFSNVVGMPMELLERLLDVVARDMEGKDD